MCIYEWVWYVHTCTDDCGDHKKRSEPLELKLRLRTIQSGCWESNLGLPEEQ